LPLSLARPVDSELLIKKSRFIGRVEPVADRVTAQRIVAELRAQHPDAAHVCWALLAGGHSAAVDDGEPSGTAGRPMLDVLRHQDLEGVLATVVRYFGGVKLGAGGLVRAYTDCIAQALKSADKVAIIRQRTLKCAIPYALEGLLRREIEAAGGALQDVQHKDSVEMRWTMDWSAADELVARLNEAGQGKLHWSAWEAVD
jgi:uncharacterized YigZ family protein